MPEWSQIIVTGTISPLCTASTRRLHMTTDAAASMASAPKNNIQIKRWTGHFLQRKANRLQDDERKPIILLNIRSLLDLSLWKMARVTGLVFGFILSTLQGTSAISWEFLPHFLPQNLPHHAEVSGRCYRQVHDRQMRHYSSGQCYEVHMFRRPVESAPPATW